MATASSPTDRLYDPRRGDQAVQTQRMGPFRKSVEPPRTNCFTIHFIESGSGTFWADTSHFPFGPQTLLFFVPYQHIRLVPKTPVQGTAIQFHANFLCVETFHAEVGCSSLLFNDPYGVPAVVLSDPDTRDEVAHLVDRLRREESERALAYREVMLAHLRILLVVATRLKSAAGAGACEQPGTPDPRHPTLLALRELIEQHYTTLHAPAEYASRLHVTPKTLGRIVREHLGTTPTHLIRNRILIHAKWQLLHTLKPVKQVARELGFVDELYFSRLFKKATGYSPSFFREFETQIRGGSNLSMFSGHAPIRPPAATADNQAVAAGPRTSRPDPFPATLLARGDR